MKKVFTITIEVTEDDPKFSAAKIPVTRKIYWQQFEDKFDLVPVILAANGFLPQGFMVRDPSNGTPSTEETIN